LTESNPTRAQILDLAPFIAELGHPRGAAYEPAATGHAVAKHAVSAYYTGRGARVDPNRVVISASTSEAYSWIFSLLCDPDDAILVPRPSYPLFGWIAASQRVRLVGYQLSREAGFRIDFDSMRRVVDRQTRAIVLVHPNNPTGSFVRREEAAALARLARKHDLALIVDEVFGDYPLGARAPDMLGSFTELGSDDGPLTFVLSGLSKVMLLPQAKLGWTAISGAAPLVTEAVARLELIADTFLSVSTPVQLALPRLLEQAPAVHRVMRGRIEANLAALDAAIVARGPHVPVRRLAVMGGWYATLEVPRIHDEDGWIELLIREEGVVVHPGYFFDFDRDGFLVVSLLPEPETFREGARRLVARLSSG
ncbi:MAG TPA: pyridoxal phosphate-dependent aminotransferase, partial [Polyangiaceae bacterium]|nr:pyridoxal phosphate-dependent aminotransferase [Polyangiaceae bacterium]